MVWNPEFTLVWNPESRRLESGIQRIEIQNPDAGIRNLEAGIPNPGPSCILLHRANISVFDWSSIIMRFDMKSFSIAVYKFIHLGVLTEKHSVSFCNWTKKATAAKLICGHRSITMICLVNNSHIKLEHAIWNTSPTRSLECRHLEWDYVTHLVLESWRPDSRPHGTAQHR